MSSGLSSNKPVLKRLGTPIDNDISTDISNLNTYVNAYGKTLWYVDGTVLASGNGTSWNTAFKTIQEAVDAASSTDIINVTPGFYDENVNTEGLLIEDKSFLKIVATGVGAIIRNTNASASACLTIRGTTEQSALGNELSNIKFLADDGMNCVDLLSNSRGTIIKDSIFQEGVIGVNSVGGYVGYNQIIDSEFFECDICIFSNSNGTGGYYGMNIFENLKMFGTSASAPVAAISLDNSINDSIKNIMIESYPIGILTTSNTSKEIIDTVTFSNTTKLFNFGGTDETVINCMEESILQEGHTNQQDSYAIYEKEEEILRYTGFNGVNVWYVDSSIISSGDGKSWLSAFKTIQEAENVRGAGDIISIRTGEYDENTNVEGLTITKDGGTFISTSQTYEGAVIVNSNDSATGTVNISGNNNKFIGLSANGIDAWTITGTGNSFKTCSSSNSTNGFVIGELANNNLFDDIRLAMISASGFEINAAGNFIKNSYAAYCGTGFKFVSGATLCVIDNVASADSTVSGFEFESGSNMCYSINCSGKNTTNIIDNSAGTSRIINFREESLITSGISNQQETRLIHDKISTIKEVTLDLSQVAGTYDAITADGDILIEGYNVYVSTAGATFNYVSIQTDDTTPLVLLSSADGAVGNLTEGAQSFSSMVPIKFAGFRLSDGKKIQYTIDGSTGTGAIKLTVKYKQVSSGSELV